MDNSFERRRNLDKAVRGLTVERNKLELQEKKLIREIRLRAKQGQVTAAKYAAKDLARTRANIARTYDMQGQLRGVIGQLSAIKTQEAMTSALASASRVMAKANGGMDPAQVQKVLENFMMTSETTELLSEIIDDAFAVGDDVDGEADQILNEILDENRLEAESQIAGTSAPASIPISVPTASTADRGTADIDQGIDNLKR